MPKPQLHIIKLHESPVLDGDNYERFSMPWILDTTVTPPATSEAFCTGDVLLIPTLLSGAGEFEAMRFLGPNVDGQENQFLILNAGVEYPEFPAVIVDAFSSEPEGGLKEAYAKLFQTYLLKSGCGVSSLLEIMGGDESDLAEFWKHPPLQRRRRHPSDDPWIIPLKDCTVEQTIKE